MMSRNPFTTGQTRPVITVSRVKAVVTAQKNQTMRIEAVIVAIRIMIDLKSAGLIRRIPFLP
jgi:hypothetical protein